VDRRGRCVCKSQPTTLTEGKASKVCMQAVGTVGAPPLGQVGITCSGLAHQGEGMHCSLRPPASKRPKLACCGSTTFHIDILACMRLQPDMCAQPVLLKLAFWPSVQAVRAHTFFHIHMYTATKLKLLASKPHDLAATQRCSALAPPPLISPSCRPSWLPP
jgi:hypothetical protein